MSKLTGKVTAHGNPALSAVVEVHNSTGDVVDQVQVDDGGAYKYHLAPGTWTLNVWDAHGHRGGGEVTLADDDVVYDIDLHEPEGGH
ncbi:MAG TPA: DUF1416 domain-containing protein [Actinomycetota bacterium]|nr:DUF1416 domain-containing protein [Actinomycetota bacterium]